MSVDITPDHDGGVLKEILIAGDGEDLPPNGCKVKAHYHGTLTDGSVFDSSVERGEPFEFTLGEGQVIKAWDLGVATMKKGEKARLTCQAKYAYGEGGSPPKIPGGATLIFDITLLSWQEEDLTVNQDGGVLRAILTKGEGFSNPAEFCLCKVQMKGCYNGAVFDEREVSFSLGEGAEVGIPVGVELALAKMKKGEKAKIKLSPRYGWPDGKEKFKLPPAATLIYELNLVEFEKDKEAWDMDACDKLAQATLLKNKATEYFQKSKFGIACKLYEKAASYIEQTQAEGYSEVEEIERKKILLAIKLNLGLVQLKLSEPYKAKLACDEALQLDANNVKGLFRRGQALLAMAEPEAAIADFKRVLELEPTNTAATAPMNACKKLIADTKAKEKQLYSNMFEKFAKKDKETYVYGWWDDSQKTPVISETLEMKDEKEEIDERKRDKKRQLEHLRKVAENKRQEREEDERKASEIQQKQNKDEALQSSLNESAHLEENQNGETQLQEQLFVAQETCNSAE